MRTITIAILLNVLFVCGVRAQTVGEVDGKLSGYLQQIDAARSDGSDKRDDMLEQANNEMADYFKKLRTDVLLMGEFPKAKKGLLDYATSEDKKLRLYYWDTKTGGTMLVYKSMAAYRTHNGVKATELDTSMGGDPGGYYTSIDMVHTKSGKAVYLVYATGEASTTDRGDEVSAYEIVGDKLLAKPFFQTKTKLVDEIGYSYDMSAPNNVAMDDQPSMHLSRDKKIFYVPVVKEDGGFTKRNLEYVFDRETFVYRK